MGTKLMDKVNQQAKDKNIDMFIVYGKAADSKLYYEEAYTTQVAEADVQDAFKKGKLMIHTVSGTTVTYFAPISVSGTTVKTIAEASGSVTATSWTAASAE